MSTSKDIVHAKGKLNLKKKIALSELLPTVKALENSEIAFQDILWRTEPRDQFPAATFLEFSGHQHLKTNCDERTAGDDRRKRSGKENKIGLKGDHSAPESKSTQSFDVS